MKSAVAVTVLGLVISAWFAIATPTEPRAAIAVSTSPLVAAADPERAGGWQPLFEPSRPETWRQIGGGIVKVRDGQLVLQNDESRNPGYVVATLQARDFQARIRCRIVTGDSGFLFRSAIDPRTPTAMIGPQVQLNADPGRGLGGIFELQGRGWVRKTPSPLNAELLDGLDLIDCQFAARGDDLHVRINGRTTVEFSDPQPGNRFRDAGLFALQIHGGSYCEIIFEEVAVRILE